MPGCFRVFDDFGNEISLDNLLSLRCKVMFQTIFDETERIFIALDAQMPRQRRPQDDSQAERNHINGNQMLSTSGRSISIFWHRAAFALLHSERWAGKSASRTGKLASGTSSRPTTRLSRHRHRPRQISGSRSPWPGSRNSIYQR